MKDGGRDSWLDICNIVHRSAVRTARCLPRLRRAARPCLRPAMPPLRVHARMLRVRRAQLHLRQARRTPRTIARGAQDIPTPRALATFPLSMGIRTFAVIAVVLYHLGFTWAQGGFQGVTIFFVLSGYLITRLLRIEFARSGTIDLKGFWVRPRAPPRPRYRDARGGRGAALHHLQPRDAHEDAARHPTVAPVLQQLVADLQQRVVFRRARRSLAAYALLVARH